MCVFLPARDITNGFYGLFFLFFRSLVLSEPKEFDANQTDRKDVAENFSIDKVSKKGRLKDLLPFAHLPDLVVYVFWF